MSSRLLRSGIRRARSAVSPSPSTTSTKSAEWPILSNRWSPPCAISTPASGSPSKRDSSQSSPTSRSGSSPVSSGSYSATRRCDISSGNESVQPVRISSRLIGPPEPSPWIAAFTTRALLPVPFGWRRGQRRRNIESAILMRWRAAPLDAPPETFQIRLCRSTARSRMRSSARKNPTEMDADNIESETPRWIARRGKVR